MTIRERALQFGPGRGLLGVLSLPQKVDSGLPAIIVPNTGFEHRVGPHRLHVHLCRAFAEAGFAALRLDLSGMGDSDSGRVNDAVADQICAMDELERLGIASQCVPIGLCSGGHDAHRFAKADTRVVAAAFLDHYFYATPKSRRISLRQKLSDPRRILDFVKRRLSPGAGAKAGGGIDAEWFEQPDQTSFQQDIDGFIQRQMPLFYLYSGEYQNIYNYPDQLLDVCPKLGDYDRYELHYFAESDHTFSQARMRLQLIDALLSWLHNEVVVRRQRIAGGGVPAPTAPQRKIAAAVTTAASVNQTRPSSWAASDAVALSGFTRKLGIDG